MPVPLFVQQPNPLWLSDKVLTLDTAPSVPFPSIKLLFTIFADGAVAPFDLKVLLFVIVPLYAFAPLIVKLLLFRIAPLPLSVPLNVTFEVFVTAPVPVKAPFNVTVPPLNVNEALFPLNAPFNVKEPETVNAPACTSIGKFTTVVPALAVIELVRMIPFPPTV